jgi:uncharacterized membrane protein
MKTNARFLGHPIHPMLVHVPLGLFVIAVVFDAICLGNGDTNLGITAFWDEVAGVAAGSIASFFGVLDLLTIPHHTRAWRVGIAHGFGNMFVMGCFALSAALRWNDVGHQPAVLAFVLEGIGLSLGSVTAWMGGELMARLGVGIDAGANPDAPSSLVDPAPRLHYR